MTTVRSYGGFGRTDTSTISNSAYVVPFLQYLDLDTLQWSLVPLCPIFSILAESCPKAYKFMAAGKTLPEGEEGYLAVAMSGAAVVPYPGSQCVAHKHPRWPTRASAILLTNALRALACLRLPTGVATGSLWEALKLWIP